MKYLGCLILLLILSCAKKEENLDSFLIRYKQSIEGVSNVKYNVKRIDTFPEDGVVWNNSGFAYIEKDPQDTIFGLLFYAKRFDINKEHIYKNSIGYEINYDRKEFKNERGAVGFLGKPGGQMVSRDIFDMDSSYSNVELKENDSVYVLKYEYEEDTLYNVTDRVKTLFLRKKDLFPVQIDKKSKVLGRKSSTQLVFSKIKVNQGTENELDSILEERIDKYKQIRNDKSDIKTLLGKQISHISLPSLKDGELITIEPTSMILLDFWETWCGPCIASFPKVEELIKKFPNDLQVIGIVSQDKDIALKLINEKKIDFLNLIGTKELQKKFSVNSFPRYFLIDESGIVINEYFGFSKRIEMDILETIAINK